VRAPAPPAYVPPGPAEALSPAKVAGLWLRGGGPDKQYFMFKQVGAQLLGLGCEWPVYFDSRAAPSLARERT
jgi:hypothetical protein